MTTKEKILCACKCGAESSVRAGDLINGRSLCCRSCACRIKNSKIPKERRVEIAKRASDAALQALKLREDPYKDKYGKGFTQLLNQAASAKQRCTNPNSIGYSNYGGRGIKFGFPSVRAYAEWVADNLGLKPSDRHSMDRIDNSRGYEAGNLRWATSAEQARNKRVYRRTKNGERIRRIKTLRPDLTYETIRLWITQGRTDDEIITRRKYDRTKTSV